VAELKALTELNLAFCWLVIDEALRAVAELRLSPPHRRVENEQSPPPTPCITTCSQYTTTAIQLRTLYTGLAS